MKFKFLFILYIILIFISVLFCSTCSYTDYLDNSWDLSPLTYSPSNPSPFGYSFSGLDGSNYFVNFCDSVSVSIGNGSCNAEGSAVCKYDGNSYISIGSASSVTFIPFMTDGEYSIGTGIQMSIQGCAANNYTTKIYVSCDQNARHGHLYSEITNFCDSTLYFRSVYGCIEGTVPTATPSRSPSNLPDTGDSTLDNTAEELNELLQWILISILSVIVCILIVVSMIFGALYNKLRKKMNPEYKSIME